jgi:hypothetical protein
MDAEKTRIEMDNFDNKDQCRHSIFRISSIRVYRRPSAAIFLIRVICVHVWPLYNLPICLRAFRQASKSGYYLKFAGTAGFSP